MAIQTRLITVSGHIQGVGFRPFVYRLATELKLSGYVKNSSGIVSVHIQGQPEQLNQFEKQLIDNAPAIAKPIIENSNKIQTETFDQFEIKKSDSQGKQDIHIPPDYFTCNDCLEELNDPEQRRYQYPFINCTQCGPRYTIIKSLPYDRPNTSLENFPLCADCFDEYTNPNDRRFHAQPLACEKCGPSISYTDEHKNSHHQDAFSDCIQALNDGQIVAIKGVGGYHLMCDALNNDAIERLRQRKNRPDKPLAVMFPMTGDDGLETVLKYGQPTTLEAKKIVDPSRPIVLIKHKNQLPFSITSGLQEVGVFLPYSPLHHLLLNKMNRPLIATSGNVSGEPVITDIDEAEKKLATITDAFLHHNRPIQRPADDSVIRFIAEKAFTIRAGRGMTPLELTLPLSFDRPVLAIGGQMKVNIALAWENRVVISPHISDLGTLRGQTVFQQVIDDLQQLYNKHAEVIICDAHTRYTGHQWAKKQDIPHRSVYHHHAHASALAGEYPEIKNWLTFTWDGVGLGEDNSLWGGEALHGKPGNWQRLASFKTFHPPGADKAGREPWRSEAALRWSMNEKWSANIEPSELAFIAWKKKINSPATSAVGRLFDAASAIILGIKKVSFEAQAPMLLEACINHHCEDFIDLPLIKDPSGIMRADWSPLIQAIIDESQSVENRSAIFHNSMAHCLIQQALHLKQYDGIEYDAIGLAGGVFQNKYLTEKIISIARTHQLNVLIPSIIPSNDGGLSFGQVIEELFTHE